jgi:LysR family transcriptional regulator, benzoate and cis,cis-muconate-responsive activator of ben and cat genes
VLTIFSNQLPTIKALQCFLAVARELSFRRASEVLGMSQPPLSRQIQALESALGVKLMHRDTHSVALTEAGAALERDAEAILSALTSSVRAMAQFSEATNPAGRQVRLGITSAIDFSSLPKLNAVLAVDSALSAKSQERAFSRHLVERVRTGKLDLAIVGDIIKPGEELVVRHVGHDPMLAMLPGNHPAAQLRRITLRDLGQSPLFWFPRSDNPILYDKCERVFESEGYRAPRLPEPNDFNALLAMVAAGEGLGVCPASMRAATRAGVVYRRFVPELERRLTVDIQLVSRAHEERKEVLSKIDQILAAVA